MPLAIPRCNDASPGEVPVCGRLHLRKKHITGFKLHLKKKIHVIHEDEEEEVTWYLRCLVLLRYVFGARLRTGGCLSDLLAAIGGATSQHRGQGCEQTTISRSWMASFCVK
eukprot:jgi/Botrbrau1/8032/Bobra.13_2s0009.1